MGHERHSFHRTPGRALALLGLVGVLAMAGCEGAEMIPARSDNQLHTDERVVAALPPVQSVSLSDATTPMLRGVSLAGAEFGFDRYGVGIHGVDYIYPTADYVRRYYSPQYFRARGMNIFRLPFRWERLQPIRNTAFSAAESRHLQRTVDYLTALGAAVILDPHNFARYDGKVIGSKALPDADFADLWRRLAEQYKGYPNVIFGLMTEPYDMPTEQWVGAANAAIAAIRAVGAPNLILVSGNAWSAAHSWASNNYGTSNAVAMLKIRDPADNTAFEAHQYLDEDNSGSSSRCVSEEIGVRRLQPFTDWLKKNGKKGFLGEFGGSASTTCLAALAGMLDHMEANAGHYIGWTYWAAGPWWGDYFMSIEPDGPRDAPQLQVLSHYLNHQAGLQMTGSSAP